MKNFYRGGKGLAYWKGIRHPHYTQKLGRLVAILLKSSSHRSALTICFIVLQLFSLSAQTVQKINNEQEDIGRENDGDIEVNVTYRYVFRKQAYESNKAKYPMVEIDHYPLIMYDLDYTTTPNIKIGDKIPSFLKSIAFQYVDKDGKNRVGTIENFSKNKLLVLDFWATWCAPCVESMHKWNDFSQKTNGDVIVLGVLLDHNFKAQYFGKEQGWTSPIVFGPEGRIINSFFFDRPVVSRMAWIKDGKLIAITGTKGYDLQLVKDVADGKRTQIPINYDWTYSQPNT